MEQISLFSLCNPDSVFNSTFYRNCFIFLLRKKRKRSLSVSVEAGGRIQITCSCSTDLRDIKDFLAHHWIWIQKQIRGRKERQIKYPIKKFRSGEPFLFQGKKLMLKYEKTRFSRMVGFYTKDGFIIYKWKDFYDLNKLVLKERLISFYKETGQRVLKKQIKELSNCMEVYPKSICIAGQRSFWGSCSSQGRISLNWRLLAAPSEVLRYVVIHELAHLKHLNHSSDFWSLVSRWCPQYQKYERWLRDKQDALDFLLLRSELHGGFTKDGVLQSGKPV